MGVFRLFSVSSYTDPLDARGAAASNYYRHTRFLYYTIHNSRTHEHTLNVENIWFYKYSNEVNYWHNKYKKTRSLIPLLDQQEHKVGTTRPHYLSEREHILEWKGSYLFGRFKYMSFFCEKTEKEYCVWLTICWINLFLSHSRSVVIWSLCVLRKIKINLITLNSKFLSHLFCALYYFLVCYNDILMTSGIVQSFIR